MPESQQDSQPKGTGDPAFHAGTVPVKVIVSQQDSQPKGTGDPEIRYGFSVFVLGPNRTPSRKALVTVVSASALAGLLRSQQDSQPKGTGDDYCVHL